MRTFPNRKAKMINDALYECFELACALPDSCREKKRVKSIISHHIDLVGRHRFTEKTEKIILKECESLIAKHGLSRNHS